MEVWLPWPKDSRPGAERAPQLEPAGTAESSSAPPRRHDAADAIWAAVRDRDAARLLTGAVHAVLADPDLDADAAIAAYAADPALRAAHGAAGLAFAETMDWDRINAAVLKVYTRVIERRERFARAGRKMPI